MKVDLTNSSRAVSIGATGHSSAWTMDSNFSETTTSLGFEQYTFALAALIAETHRLPHMRTGRARPRILEILRRLAAAEEITAAAFTEMFKGVKGRNPHAFASDSHLFYRMLEDRFSTSLLQPIAPKAREEITIIFLRRDAIHPLPAAYQSLDQWDEVSAEISIESPVPLPSRPYVIPGDFSPSDALATLWWRSVADRVGPEAVKVTLNDIKAAFFKRYRRMLSVLAEGASARDEELVILSERGRFHQSILFEIQRRFMVRLDETTPFFLMLHRELSTFLKQGGKFSGAWGALEWRNDGMILRAARQATTPVSPVGKLATILE